MLKLKILSLSMIGILLMGCETKTQTGILAGGGLGAAVGGIAGGGQGALIGGAVGVIGGALIGSALDAQDRETMERQHPQTLDRIDNNQQLSYDDVIKMSKSGLSDDTIIGMIQKTNSHYKMTTDKVQELENAGVSQKVINYMIST
ncbi:MAG: hypothetical protein HY860_03960 [Chlamydiales bacterium]|nr:hypothetical protein [Chlamydiales bacterium]